ncbi:hypothetical protein [Poriferisphaera sp. WC338]|uniref:hypothetical protein n=1 Tax=Poriferisphaera sp. WC338 TaxID=3425129 RepID=UPI003D814CF4
MMVQHDQRGNYQHTIDCICKSLVASLRESNLGQREYARLAVQTPAVLVRNNVSDSGHITGYETVCKVWITDISQSGIGMLLEKTIEADRLYWVDVSSLAPRTGCECSTLLPFKSLYLMRLLPETFRTGGPFVTDAVKLNRMVRGIV